MNVLIASYMKYPDSLRKEITNIDYVTLFKALGEHQKALEDIRNALVKLKQIKKVKNKLNEKLI